MLRLFFAFIYLLDFSCSSAKGIADTAGPVSLLYRGIEYTKIISPLTGTPFLYGDQPTRGNLFYFGANFDNIEIQYDIENDVVVTRDFTGQIRVQLVSEKLSSFEINGHQFTRLPGNIGFYEVVYRGDRQVYVKWQKVLSRKGVEEARYETYQQVFVQENKELMLISSRADLLKLFGKHKKRAADYIRVEGLDFKKDLPGAVASVIRFADKNGLHD